MQGQGPGTRSGGGWRAAVVVKKCTGIKDATLDYVRANYDTPDYSKPQTRVVVEEHVQSNLSAELWELCQHIKAADQRRLDRRVVGPEVADACKMCIKAYEKMSNTVERHDQMCMRNVLEKGMEVVKLVNKRCISELFSLLCARFIEVYVAKGGKSAGLSGALECFRDWLKDYADDLRLQAFGLTDGVNKEYNMSLFAGDLRGLRSSLTVLSECEKLGDIEKVIGLCEVMETVNDLVSMIPSYLVNFVFAVEQSDDELCDRLLKFCDQQVQEDVKDDRNKPWIIADIRNDIDKLAVARRLAMRRVRVLYEHQSDFDHVRVLLDRYLSFGRPCNEKFAVYLRCVISIMEAFDCSVTLPSVDSVINELGISALAKSVTTANDEELVNAVPSFRTAVLLITEYENILLKHPGHDDGLSCPWPVSVMNVFILLLQSKCFDWTGRASAIMSSLSSGLSDSVVADLLPACDCSLLLDGYFQFKEFMLYMSARNDGNEKLYAQMRCLMAACVEHGEAKHDEFFSAWDAVSSVIDVSFFDDVFQLIKLTKSLSLFLGYCGIEKVSERLRYLFIVCTFINVNKRLDRDIVEVRLDKLHDDKMTDMSNLWETFLMYDNFADSAEYEDILGKPADDSEAYRLGFCALQIHIVKSLFIQYCWCEVPTYAPAKFEHTTGRILNVCGKICELGRSFKGPIATQCAQIMSEVPSDEMRDLFDAHERYAKSRALWCDVSSEYVAVYKCSGKWLSRHQCAGIAKQMKSIDQTGKDLAAAEIERAKLDAEKIRKGRSLVVKDPGNPDDLRQAERLTELSRATCLDTVRCSRPPAEHVVTDMQRETTDLVASIRERWRELRSKDRGTFDQALHLVRAVETEQNVAVEEEAAGMLIADTEKQLKVLRSSLAFEKGEAQRHEDILQFVSLTCPRAACDRGTFENNTVFKSRSLIKSLVEKRQELIDLEAELANRLNTDVP